MRISAAKETKSIWTRLINKAESFFKPADLQKEDENNSSENSPDIKKPDTLKKLFARIKEKAREAGFTDAQICEAEHCGTAGPKMSVCLMTYCGSELGLGGNDAAQEEKSK
jgi:hypothetical protein